nr:unnamed protein product [Digitaria exilis]
MGADARPGQLEGGRGVAVLWPEWEQPAQAPIVEELQAWKDGGETEGAPGEKRREGLSRLPSALCLQLPSAAGGGPAKEKQSPPVAGGCKGEAGPLRCERKADWVGTRDGPTSLCFVRAVDLCAARRFPALPSFPRLPPFFSRVLPPFFPARRPTPLSRVLPLLRPQTVPA